MNKNWLKCARCGQERAVRRSRKIGQTTDQVTDALRCSQCGAGWGEVAPATIQAVPHYSRRAFLNTLLLGAVACTLDYTARAALAAELVRTPPQTEGPFYPDHLPLDKDNDLIIIRDHTKSAVGEITHLGGRILDARGNPVRGAVIEIWQADHNGVYLHSQDGHAERDPNFQGFGRFETGSTGEYRFRTIKPMPYPGRTPHIHVKVWKGNRELLTTQCYVQGHPLNARDGVLNDIEDPKQRASVLVPFTPIKGSRTGELAARFDIILGWTPPA